MSGSNATRPLLRPAEVLETVPGWSSPAQRRRQNQSVLSARLQPRPRHRLRHLADGDAHQPPTHAHGQGYTDLNLLIPGFVASVRYRKGPYHAADGDFGGRPGPARLFRSLRQIPCRSSSASITATGWSRRGAAGERRRAGAAGAIEAAYNNGPWAERENLRRLNGVLRLSSGSVDNGWAVTLMAFESPLVGHRSGAPPGREQG